MIAGLVDPGAINTEPSRSKPGVTIMKREVSLPLIACSNVLESIKLAEAPREMSIIFVPVGATIDRAAGKYDMTLKGRSLFGAISLLMLGQIAPTGAPASDLSTHPRPTGPG